MAKTNPDVFEIVDNYTNYAGAPYVNWNYTGMQRCYAVQVNWRSPGYENSMYYNINIECARIKDGNAAWKIRKTNYYIDNKRPENTIELLASACAEPCYPFEFTTAINGRMTSLLNIEKVKTRFAGAKPVLLRNFGGEAALQYISATEKALSNPQQLKALVTEDFWLALFFAPITGGYNSIKSKPITVNFPFFKFEQPLVFEGTSVIGKPDTDRKSQAINVEAVLIPGAVTAGKTILNGAIEATYDIDIPGHQIRNISSHITINTADGEHAIWLTGYQVEMEQADTTAAPEEPKQQSKGWFSIFSD